MTPTQTIESEAALNERVERLLKAMTLTEKVSLLSGQDVWNTVPIERLGIRSVVMTDGPHGVRASNPETGRPMGPATCFPTGVSFAATWNPELIERVGEALGEETLGMGCDILLGPCVNIVRGPLGGRNFESYSEDPYLAGRIAVAWIKGVQAVGAGTSLKHFATNNQEIERFRSSSNVDERTLREIYLPAFEAAVKEADPWTVMCSYNRINGVYASQNKYLMRDILKGEWGYKGFVVSDWGANHTTVESVVGGLDMEMPGPAKYYGKLLVEAVAVWQIEEALIDESVRRILRIAGKACKLDEPAGPRGAANTPEHQALAREVAEEAITLLKNDGGLLPLDVSKLQTLAVIGPNATGAHFRGGGSSDVEPPYEVSPLDALRARLGDKVKIEYAQGCDNYVELPVIQTEWLGTPNARGMQAEFFNNLKLEGAPAVSKTLRRAEMMVFGSTPAEGVDRNFSMRATAQLTVPETSRYRFKVRNTGCCRVYLDGEVLLDNTGASTGGFDADITAATAMKDLTAGQAYTLKIEYAKDPSQDYAACQLALVASPRPEDDHRMADAVALAQRSDMVLIFAGMPEHYETEGNDRPHMDLPGRQDELIRAVVAANPKTIVVLNAGSPVAMPWIAETPAVVEAYYPGMEAGNAIANILLGDVNPSGKLTETFPVRLADSPAYINTARPGTRQIEYGEGIFVGYRYYDERGVEPLFPFGHGLSYTTFEYGPLDAPAEGKVGETIEVSLTVKNSGTREGKEAVQLYVADKECSEPRPPKELKGFAKVSLKPGETQTVKFTLDARAFSFYDAHARQWTAEPGEFELLAGASSRDIRSRATVTLK
jgi:beta-glucosidase